MQQFKVGDWVKTKAGFIKQISCLTGDKCDTLSIGNTSVGINVVFKNEIELWQPKEGEWCWFWNRHTNISPLIRKFEYIFNGDFYTNGQMIFTHCEPFIGNLPTFLKDE